MYHEIAAAWIVVGGVMMAIDPIIRALPGKPRYHTWWRGFIIVTIAMISVYVR